VQMPASLWSAKSDLLQRECQKVRQFDGLVASDRRGDGDNAAVAGEKARSLLTTRRTRDE
jgi:hypothetical protein